MFFFSLLAVTFLQCILWTHTDGHKRGTHFKKAFSCEGILSRTKKKKRLKMSLIISYASLSCDDLAYSRKYNYDTDRKATQFSVMAFDIL